MKLELKILELLKQGETLILSTIYEKSGSVPRKTGANMIVLKDGTIFGTIGGGRVELNTINFAKEFINEEKQATFLRYNLKPGKDGENIDMICGGQVTILLEKISPTDENIKIFTEYQNALEKNISSVWLYDTSKVLSDGKLLKYLVNKYNIPSNLPKKLIDEIFINNNIIKKAKIFNIENKTFFIQPLMNKGSLIIVGAGHVALELSELASRVDFRVTVIDDRSDFANKSRFPLADKIIVVKNFDNIFENIKVDNNTYIVILTRAHLHDQNVLEQALKTKATYIGMIGSKTKRNTIYKNLMEKNISEEQLKTVHSPIGLDILCETPMEIAISIVAELIKERSS